MTQHTESKTSNFVYPDPFITLEFETKFIRSVDFNDRGTMAIVKIDEHSPYIIENMSYYVTMMMANMMMSGGNFTVRVKAKPIGPIEEATKFIYSGNFQLRRSSNV